MTATDKRPSGRPTLTGETLKVVQVRLTADQIATARRLGAGNLSEGVRRALSDRQKFPIDSTADVV